MTAILTGSQVYGNPRDYSDIDLVVLTDKETLLLLSDFADSVGNSDDADVNGYDRRSLMFGRLNLIIVTRREDFEVWRQGTEQLKTMQPVDRKTACKVFIQLRELQEKLTHG